jgi:hypothetical protein
LVTSTAELTVSPGAEFQVVPGLDTTVDVPANSFVYLSLNGGMRMPTGGVDDALNAYVSIFVDGTSLSASTSREVRAAFSGSGVPVYYSMATLVTLSAGTHTVTVKARGLAGSQDAIIGGDSGTVTHAALSMLVLKQ